MLRTRPLLLALGLLVCIPLTHGACGSAGCAVNTQWETQGPHLGTGWRIDLRLEHIKQATLREGSDKIGHPATGGSQDDEHNEEEHEEEAHGEAHRAYATGAKTRPARPSHEGEQHAEHDERSTRNRNARIHLDYSIDANWGVSIELPVVARKHRHIELEDGAEEKWDFTALGDVRVIGRYIFSGDATSSWGLNFGAKLSTGKFDEENDAGARAERSLQPGTGTTDAILGAFYQRSAPASAWSWFAQAFVQQPLDERDEFKPGRLVSVDAGASYRFTPRFAALLQLNLQHRARDHGAAAEPEASGGKFAFLSPGVQLRLGQRTQGYAFVQIPLYQYVNGTQLTADKALLLGLSHRF